MSILFFFHVEFPHSFIQNKINGHLGAGHVLCVGVGSDDVDILGCFTIHSQSQIGFDPEQISLGQPEDVLAGVRALGGRFQGKGIGAGGAYNGLAGTKSN